MKNWLKAVLIILVLGIISIGIGGKGCNPWEKDDDDEVVSTGSSGVGPFDLVATVVSSSQINLTWKHDLNPAQEPVGTGFELQRKTGAEGTYETIATLGLVTSYQDTPLSDTTTYYYRVSAYHTVGGSKVQYSNWSNEVFATTQEEAGTPAVWTQTTDTDFDGGTKNQIAISGTGTAASVILDTISWTQATAAADWSGRWQHTSVVYDNKMWVIGGYETPDSLNDVWSSTDGISWSLAVSPAAWSARYGHTSVVYDGKMWVIGGWDVTIRNDVWWSTDGVNWTEATSSAPWSTRVYHTSAVYDGKMWVIGGWGATAQKNDVWWSTDGVNWTEATSSALWLARLDHTSVFYDSKMWVIGGDDGTNLLNDVWWSTDGISWSLAVSPAAWSDKQDHTSVVYDGKMWVIGGHSSNGYENNVWWSTDGVNWTEATSAPWEGRRFHTSVVYDGKTWVIGGYNKYSNMLNDVWYNQPSYYSSGDLVSSAKDTGANPDYTTISWTESVPVSCTLKFQLASNNDNATWDFIGPDGTNATYYTTSGASIHSSHDGDRYIRYKAYLSTTDTSVTPCLEDITISYTVP